MSVHDTSIHAGREVIYAMLSRFFIEVPSQMFCKELKNLMPMLENIKDSDDGESAVNVGIDGISEFLAVRSSKSGSELEEFDFDTLRGYTRLFCLTDSVPVSESVYLSAEGITMQAQRDDALRFYKMCSFSFDSDSNEPEDHISYELMFMSYMAKVTRNAITNKDTVKAANVLAVQRDFLNSHLLKWGGLFAGSIKNYHSGIHSSLYLSAALLMAGFIECDNEFLSE